MGCEVILYSISQSTPESRKCTRFIWCLILSLDLIKSKFINKSSNDIRIVHIVTVFIFNFCGDHSSSHLRGVDAYHHVVCMQSEITSEYMCTSILCPPPPPPPSTIDNDPNMMLVVISTISSNGFIMICIVSFHFHFVLVSVSQSVFSLIDVLFLSLPLSLSLWVPEPCLISFVWLCVYWFVYLVQRSLPSLSQSNLFFLFLSDHCMSICT